MGLSGAVAMTSTADTSGRNIEPILALLDGAAGTADPAFSAHILPTRHLATAIWEKWVDIEESMKPSSTPV